MLAASKLPPFKSAFACTLGGGLALLMLVFLYFQFLGGGLASLQSRLETRTIALDRSALPAPYKPAPAPEATEHSEESSPTIPQDNAPAEAVAETAPTALAKAALEPDPQGITRFSRYKKPYQDTGKPAIALLVRDYGLSSSLSEEILKSLPAEISLLLSPYADQPREWGEKARENGHEFWLTIPFQPRDLQTQDPGGLALLTLEGMKYNQESAAKIMDSAREYPGIAVFTDPVSLKSDSLLQNVIYSFFSQGLGFLELNPDASRNLESYAVSNGYPYSKATQVYDDDIWPDIRDFLERLAQSSQSDGFAVGVVDLQPAQIPRLKSWLASPRAQDFSLAPVSALAAMAIPGDAGPEASPNASPEASARTPSQAHHE